VRTAMRQAGSCHDVDVSTYVGRDQDFDESGRRESNPRSQLGKIVQADPANVGEPEGQVGDSANMSERPRTDTDAP
jgi:hypothetical protein